jgi:hypothetical protein
MNWSGKVAAGTCPSHYRRLSDVNELTRKDRLAQANSELEETIERNMRRARQRVLERLDLNEEWDTTNLNALIAFEALRGTETERQNLRSMQAWLAVKAGREQLYLAFPPTEERPEGFGSLTEFLEAAGVGAKYKLNILAMVVTPLLDKHGYRIEDYLNRDRYPKLAEARSTLKDIAEGTETEHTVEGVMDDVERATNRNDIRLKYSKRRGYVADGAVNRLGAKRTMVIVADEEQVESFIRALQGRVDWHAISATAEQRDHEVVLRLLHDRGKG